MTTIKPLPLPSFFDPKNAEDWNYGPNEGQLFELAPRWAKKHGVKPAGSDRVKIHVLGIDDQNDFNKLQGSLFVGGRSGRGAIEDDVRFATFLYQYAHLITDTTFTLDTHFAHQIFFGSFWVNERGDPLNSHTLIVLSSNERSMNNIGLDGKLLHEDVRPNPSVANWVCNGNYPWLYNQALHYNRELARVKKYTLYLWPPHCLMGGSGYRLSGVVHEARLFLSVLRGTESSCEVKGGNPLTENYSIFRPEVLTRWDGKPLAQKNTRFLERLIAADVVVIGGQAASHCVKSSIEDLLEELLLKDEKLVQKVYVLEDCMSAVAVPDGKGGFVADFTPQAEEAIQKFRDAGMHVVKSTDPIQSWTDIKL